jgi:hypothetical protein
VKKIIRFAEKEDKILTQVAESHDDDFKIRSVVFCGLYGEGYEAFSLRVDAKDGLTYRCKTGMHPYDTVVMAALIRASVCAGKLGDKNGIMIGSDGRWDIEWMKGRELYNRVWPEDNIFGEDVALYFQNPLVSLNMENGWGAEVLWA